MGDLMSPCDDDIVFAEQKHPGAVILPVTAKNPQSNNLDIKALPYAALASWKDGNKIRKRLYRSRKKMSIVTFMSKVCQNHSRLWDRCLMTLSAESNLIKVSDFLQEKFDIYPVNRHRVSRANVKNKHSHITKQASSREEIESNINYSDCIPKSPLGNCPVCWEPFDDQSRHKMRVSVPCGHPICDVCVADKRISNVCPTCREPFNKPFSTVRVFL